MILDQKPRKLLQNMLAGEDVGAFPSIIPINPPVVAVMKECGVFWPGAHRDARLMAELAAACQETLRFNAVNVPFDMTVEAEALGCKILWKEGRGATPQIREGQCGESPLDVDEMVLEQGRIPTVLRAISLLRKRFDDSVPVISFFEGPFTLAGLVTGVNSMYKYLLKDPGRAREVLNVMARVVTLYATHQLSAGADTAIMLDPNVMGLTEKQFTEFVLPLYGEITAAIDRPLILHICGDVNSILHSLPHSGFAAFSFEYPAVRVEAVRKALGTHMKIIGSVPTVTHLLQGTKDEVFAVSLELIERGVDILAPSCFTPPESPLENVRAMKEAIEHWNRNNVIHKN